ncbi:hypothetical protein ANN_02614 [Periplaneta americana]|uniref:DUF4817 domain-containing protein n=1 Tax=Periplaneta americana TaxID=6978 RepID=A0ABQ8TZR1_PERAM|nr:hypothetical protein ANN_02614 [Periplaneta americana]
MPERNSGSADKRLSRLRYAAPMAPIQVVSKVMIKNVGMRRLFKGSTTPGPEGGSRSSPAERPKTLRRLKNVYDNTSGANGTAGKLEDGEEVITKRSTSSSSRSGGGTVSTGSGSGPGGDKGQSLSILSPFDEQEEWAKISEIMASFGTGLVRESVFVSELEKEFQSRLVNRCSYIKEHISSEPRTVDELNFIAEVEEVDRNIEILGGGRSPFKNKRKYVDTDRRILRIVEKYTQNKEYADIVYVYGLCDGNATAAVLAYQARFPNRRIPSAQFKVCHGSLYAVMWLADEPTEFNLPTLPQRCITYEAEKLPSKYGVHSEEYIPIRTVTPVVAGM